MNRPGIGGVESGRYGRIATLDLTALFRVGEDVESPFSNRVEDHCRDLVRVEATLSCGEVARISFRIFDIAREVERSTEAFGAISPVVRHLGSDPRTTEHADAD